MLISLDFFTAATTWRSWHLLFSIIPSVLKSTHLFQVFSGLHSERRAATTSRFKCDTVHLHLLHCCRRQPRYTLSTPERSHPVSTRALTLKLKGEKTLLALLCQEELEQDYF